MSGASPRSVKGEEQTRAISLHRATPSDSLLDDEEPDENNADAPSSMFLSMTDRSATSLSTLKVSLSDVSSEI